jgi:hypothetical protein
MSTLLNPRISLAITGAISDGLTPPVVTGSINHTVNPSLPVGTSSGSVNLEYHASIAVSSGSPLVLDLTNLTDPLGQPITFAVVNAILLTNDSTTATNDLSLGGGTHPLIATCPLVAQATGGAVAFLAPAVGMPVTSGSTNNLQIAAAAGSAVPGRLTILGR